ncbi:MAG: tetratricopeptide repeat protein [Bacteroidales bacterium]|nr:tetratricopeptide repeat protein [Bacteroidales bacterium]
MKKFLISLFCLTLLSNAFAQSEVVGEAPNDTIEVKQDLAKNAEYFSKGIEAKYNENYEVAIWNFEQALRFFKDDDASMYELSALYHKNNRNVEALSMIKQAANLKPDNKWYQIRLAKLYLQNSDYKAFMQIYDKLLEKDPENLEYLEDYIGALITYGEYDKLLEKLDTIEKLLGKNEQIFLQKIQVYSDQGKKDKVISELENLVDFMPENTRYRAMLAEAYRKAKRDKDAYLQYMKIKELDPEDKYINVSLMDYYLNVSNKDKAFEEFLAAINNPNLEYDTKVQLCKLFMSKYHTISGYEIATIGTTFINAYPEKSAGYNLVGTLYYMQKDYLKAKEFYVNAVKYGDTEYATLAQLAMCYGILEDYKGTIEYTNRAIALYPDQPYLYQLNAVGHLMLNDYENALMTLEKGRRFVADQSLMLTFDTNIADCYYKLKNKEKLYETYNKILAYNPDNVYVLNNYAYYLSLEEKDLERALEMSAKTIKAEPKNATYLDTYAWILYKLGRYEEAKKYMEKVFKYDKKPQGVNYEHLGDILFKLGDTKNAVKNWKKAKKAGGEVSEFLEQKIIEEKLYE